MPNAQDTQSNTNFPDLSQMPPLEHSEFCEVRRFRVRFHEDLSSHCDVAILYIDSIDASHAKEAAINMFLSNPRNKMWCMNDNFDEIIVFVDEVNNGKFMCMRDFHAEQLDTQVRIKDICTPCQWTWDLCPNTMCVMAIRNKRTQNLMRVLGNKL